MKKILSVLLCVTLVAVGVFAFAGCTKTSDLKYDVALITDGRFSGGTSGLSIGHVSPEAAEGGIPAVVFHSHDRHLAHQSRAATDHAHEDDPTPADADDGRVAGRFDRLDLVADPPARTGGICAVNHGPSQPDPTANTYSLSPSIDPIDHARKATDVRSELGTHQAVRDPRSGP